MRSARALSTFFLLLGAGCLEDPELRSCGEFAFGTAGCGSPCDVYCEEVLRACPGTFVDADDCEVKCALEPAGGVQKEAGTQGDTSGDTLACRITQALAGNCAEVGLLDSQACGGASCAEYCDLMLASCSGAYPSRQNCLETCAALPPGASDADANTLRCRIRYARMAGASDPLACDAASMGGGGVCGDVCEIYCDFLDVNCAGSNAIYDSRAECTETCKLLDTAGLFDDWSFDVEADTVQCRLYHAGPPAGSQPAVHCPHASVYNDEHCGIQPGVPEQPPGWPCSTFCATVEFNCPGTYPSPMACTADCATFPEVVALIPGQSPNIYPVTSTTCPTR